MLTKNNLIHKNNNVKCFFAKDSNKSSNTQLLGQVHAIPVPKKGKNGKIVRKCATKLEETWLQ